MIRRPIETIAAGFSAFCAMAASLCAAGELAPLGGHWRGSGVDLLIDTDRLQANTDPERPFARVPLVIRNVTGRMFFFSIGRDSFIARANGDVLSVTRLGSQGTFTLNRVR